MNKISKLLLLLLAIPVLVLVCAAVLLPILVSKELILSKTSEALYAQTGAQLTVKGMAKLSLFPTAGVKLGDISLVLPGDEATELQARSLAIGVKLMPLLSNSVEIVEIALDGLSMTIVSETTEGAQLPDPEQLSDRQLDLAYAERREAMTQAANAATSQPISPMPVDLNIAQLLISDAQITIVDPDGQDSQIKIAKLKAKDINLHGDLIPLVLQLQVRTGQDAPPLALALDGNIRIRGDSQIISLEPLAIEVQGAVAETLRLSASGDFDSRQMIADLTVEFSSGPFNGDGSVRYAAYQSPQLDAKLHVNLLDPALFALAGPEAATEAQQDAPVEVSGDEPLPLAALRQIDSQLELLVDRAVFDAHSIEQLQVNARIVDGIATLSSLTGKLYGGQLALTAVFNGQHNNASFTTEGSVSNLDVAAALAATTPEQPPALSGQANMTWQLESRGASINALTQAAKGPIKLEVKQAVLEQLSIEKMLCETAALINQETVVAVLPEQSTFKDLSMDLNLENGKVQLDPLRALLPQVSLRGKGSLDPLSQDFELRFEANVNAQMADLDPACRVNKRLTEIDWPVECKGNAAGDPADWCKVDSDKIISEMAKNEVRHQVEKQAGKLLDKLFNRD